MNRAGFALSMVLIVASAAWAYHVNYQTVEELERINALRARIGIEREAIQVLRVEWAHLNAPARLEALVSAADRHLTLFPMAPAQFGEVAAIPYPKRPPLDALGAETTPPATGPVTGPVTGSANAPVHAPVKVPADAAEPVLTPGSPAPEPVSYGIGGAGLPPPRPTGWSQQ